MNSTAAERGGIATVTPQDRTLPVPAGPSRSVRRRLAIADARRPSRSVLRQPVIGADKLVAANAALRAENRTLTSSLNRVQEFAGELSHDLKAPLITIVAYADLLNHLDANQMGAGEYHGFLKQITTSAERMQQLIDDVLESLSARDDEISAEPTDLAALVGEVAQECLDRFRAAHEGPPPEIIVDELPPVTIDAVMVRRVFDNLLGNAIKYVGHGDVARVRVSGRPDTRGWVRIDVTDNGIGIPDGQHEMVFAGRYRAHADAGYPGTGLGLNICRRIVEEHGGLIGAEPAETGGTRFWLTLPAVAG
ncbi:MULTISPECIES: HAMP domain-containing sensor histidine kinase [Actinoplanes]|uniref:sensor histidine kinase n=1 Tax=Actinoplanes TaxID=1865 RepID=UPI000AEFF2B6|nr:MULTISPECIES: HAMP domain-containing sensor histidine kinase [Actinoplanes]GLX99854.1 hypothetical protein Acsp01_02340 [Actinoplanes sp. NBRC 101535]